MRMTLDLPDELLKRSRIEAVERGFSLEELIAIAIVKEVETSSASKAPRRVRFPLFASKEPGSLELIFR